MPSEPDSSRSRPRGSAIRACTVQLAAAVLAATIACGGTGAPDTSATVEPQPASTRLRVYVVNYPLAYFTERIAGEHAEVVLPDDLTAGDPAFAQPAAETVAAFQRADLIVRNGAGYARWMDRATLPQSRVVDTTRAVADELITVAGAISHSHGPEGEHTHGETAFTTWLDPRLAAEQATAIAAALSAARPELSAEFDTGVESLRGDLAVLDARLEAVSATLGDTPLLASHPVYQYLARRYAWNLESVHFEPDAMPDETAWTALTALLGEHPAAWMIWEAPPSPEIVARLSSSGIGVVVFDPCATPPAASDFLAVMQANVAALEGLAEGITNR